MKYDDASWHIESTPDGPEDERWDAAAAHIAVYLRWCLLKGWAGELHTSDADSVDSIKAVLAGTMRATEFLSTHCDSKLMDEDLNDEGNAFTAFYYDSGYADDLEHLSGGGVLSLPEESYDLSRFQEVLDKRYAEWVAAGRPAEKPARPQDPSEPRKPKKPWWKMW